MRIEEAFQIHANTRKIPIKKKTKYRPGIGQAIPVSQVSPDRYLDTGIARPIPGRYLVFFVIGILRVFVCIWKASSIRTDT